MQTVERPRFRQDLVAEAIEEGGQKFIDVGDPESGHMFRFYESEFSIACGMDGERDVAGIVAWAKDELGLMATSKEVRSVISQLAELSFLDQGPAARAAATERPSAAPATELAAGVVVGQQQKRAPAGVDVELGSAGAKAAASAPLPKSSDIELGTPGAGAVAAKAPRPPVEDVGLGAPGARAPAAAAKSDVSLDLADHMGVKADDVKEAIRQSKQMSAVEVPKDLLDQVEAPVPPPKAAPVVEKKPAPAAVSEKKPEAKPASATPAAVTAPVAAEKKPVEKKPEAKPAEKKVEKKPEAKPVVVAEKKPMPEAPKQGISPVLIILLVLAIGGAGAYFAWKYLISKKAETTSEVQPPPVTPGSQVAAPQPPPPPPAPKGKIEIAPGAERDILSVFPGNVESIDTTERDVDTSDVIARLAGAKRLETEMAGLDKEIERRKATLTAAEEARNKLNPSEGSGSGAAKAPSEAQLKAADAKVDTAYKALEDKQNERATKEESLEKLYVRAPFEGKIVVLAKQGQKIEENTPIARITPKPAPTAVFKLEKNMTLERGLAVPIKVGEKMYTCEVADSNVDGTRVVCRQNAQDLAAGAEATLMVEQAQ